MNGELIASKSISGKLSNYCGGSGGGTGGSEINIYEIKEKIISNSTETVEGGIR